jgi:hypothetical protein
LIQGPSEEVSSSQMRRGMARSGSILCSCAIARDPM